MIREKNNDISLYLGLFEKSPTVLRKAIVTTPYSGDNTLFCFKGNFMQEKSQNLSGQQGEESMMS